MESIREGARRRSRRTFTSRLMLALLAALLLAVAALAAAAPAGAAAKPGKPTAKAPKGPITTAKPTFTWSKAARATRYELRVYKGSTLLLKKAGISKRSWTSSKSLPKNVALTWKVRARNARGLGTWSRSLSFEVALAIGDSYEGGKVAYLLQSGDPGYVQGQVHGLIAAGADQSASAVWSNIAGTVIGAAAQGLAIGTGRANTTAIVGQTVGDEHCTRGAAYLCDNLVEGGHDDWYLPSRDELNQLYVSQSAIGGFNPTGYYAYYWSSSEGVGELDPSLSIAWGQYFYDGRQFTDYKTNIHAVRAVRAF